MHNIALLVATKRLNFKPRLSHQDNSSLCPLQGNVNCCLLFLHASYMYLHTIIKLIFVILQNPLPVMDVKQQEVHSILAKIAQLINIQ